MVWRYVKKRRDWTDARLGLTHDLVERMVGHRTCLAQEPRASRHDDNDKSLAEYLETATLMDRVGILLPAMLPRGWMLVAVLVLTPAFVRGTASAAELAISLGGVIFAFRSFQKLGTGIANLAGAVIAWGKVRTLFEAAARPTLKSSPGLTVGGSSAADGEPLLEAG